MTIAALTEAEQQQIERFVNMYLRDLGIGVLLLEQVALIHRQETHSDQDHIAQTMVSQALIDVLGRPELFTGQQQPYSLDRVIGAGASLFFLVKHCKLIDPMVLPREVILSDDLMAKILKMFNEDYCQEALSTSPAS